MRIVDFDTVLMEEFARLGRTLPDVQASPWLKEALGRAVEDRLNLRIDHGLIAARLWERVLGPAPRETSRGSPRASQN